MSLDKDKLQQEMAGLPLSTISTTIAAASTSTAAAAASSSLAHSASSHAPPTRSATSTASPDFLSKVITGAVNEVLASSSFSSSS